jgi:hypothetical protein
MTRHLSFANVAAALALVVALGTGGAYAASLAKNSVGSAQIKNSAVKSADVKNDALTGADVKESSLAKVPSAAKVDTVKHLVFTPIQGATPTVAVTNGPLKLRAGCGGAPGGATAVLLLDTTVDHTKWATYNGGDNDFNVAEPEVAVAQGVGQLNRFDLAVFAPTGETLEVSGFVSATSTTCHIDLVVVG